MQDNYLRFISLRLRDYKVFRGLNDFCFNRDRTLIVGKEGTGKTIISEALENLGPSERPRETLTMKDHAVSSVDVITEGNRELVNQYRHFIFLNRECAEYSAAYNQEPKLRAMIPNSGWKAVVSETQTIFQRILSPKPWKIDLHHDFNPEVMAAGERACLGYAFIFAVREVLKLDIPVVLDSPYGMLDEGLQKGMFNFLKTQPCQQILLGYECEFSEREKPDYVLAHAEGYSHVLEFK